MPGRRKGWPLVIALPVVLACALLLLACGRPAGTRAGATPAGTPRRATASRGPATTPAQGTPTASRSTATSAGSVSATPMLTLEPDRGTCNTHVTVRGSGFPPGKQISIGAWPIVPYYHDVGYGLENGTVVEVDSTFTVEITPLNFGCRSGSLQLVISAG